MSVADISNDAALAASGVEGLIAQLYNEGVQAGEDEKVKILEAANVEAERIKKDAQKEADKIVEKAKKESEKIKKSTDSALKVSANNLILKIKEIISEKFSNALLRLTSEQMKEEEFVKQLILVVAARARKDAQFDNEDQMEVILPREIVDTAELSRHPEKVKKGTLGHLVLDVSGELLREGIEFSASDDISSGLKIKLPVRDMEVDLSDKAVTELLLQHLQPRFRAFLEGVMGE